MPQSLQSQSDTSTSLSEIFPVKLMSKNYQSFRVNPNIDKSIGNRLSWRLSDKNNGYIVIFERESKYFWLLGKPEIILPDQIFLQARLDEILVQLQSDLGDTSYTIQDLEQSPIITSRIEAELAVQVLKFSGQIFSETLFSSNNVKVETDVDDWAETFEFNRILHPAIALNLKTRMIYEKDLQHFFNHHHGRGEPDKLLINLQVKPLDSSSKATIIRLAGKIEERRDELIAKASNYINQESLRNAPNDEPIVSIKFGKNNQFYDYPLSALKPLVTSATSYLFNVKYGDLLKKTKLLYQQRTKLFTEIRKDLNFHLHQFDFQLSKSINTKSHSSLFIQPVLKIEAVELLFGRQVKDVKKINGLKKGGVYRRHSEFKDLNRKIRLGIIKPENMIVGDFRKQLEEEIKSYQFNIILPEESRKNYDVESLSFSQVKVKIEEIVDELAEQALDLVLVFLSGSKNDENTENDDLYISVKRFLLRRDIASQVVYTNTLNKPENYRNILNNIVSGILAKLGNLPFVLAEPLVIAEAFVGLDVSRFSYQNRSGSRNVCASVRFYGRQGEFIRYRLESDLIEGEEIPRHALENFFPSVHFKNKVVLIYRDGRFQGDEVKHLLARANAIDAKFILVESVKSRVPRLYNLNNGNLSQPTRGLGLKLSEREVILVTTSVSENIGVPRPIRLRIHEDGEQASLEQLIDATLKLTLLHHGSLKDPRLPIPLYGSDAIAYRRLQGIYPTNPEGDRQFWL